MQNKAVRKRAIRDRDPLKIQKGRGKRDGRKAVFVERVAKFFRPLCISAAENDAVARPFPCGKVVIQIGKTVDIAADGHGGKAVRL